MCDRQFDDGVNDFLDSSLCAETHRQITPHQFPLLRTADFIPYLVEYALDIPGRAHFVLPICPAEEQRTVRSIGACAGDMRWMKIGR